MFPPEEERNNDDLHEDSPIMLIKPVAFNDPPNPIAYRSSTEVDMQIMEEMVPASRPVARSKRSYNYGYSYNTGRGYGSGYGHGTRHGHCHNCHHPGRALGAAVVVGGAALAGGLIGSAVGK